MRYGNRWTLSALLVTMIAVSACSASIRTGGRAGTEAGARATLDQIVAAWNRDDLAAHVAPYSETATYTQSNGLLVGRSAIQAMLQRAFGRTDGLAGDLAFSDINIRMMGDNHALATGAFVVSSMPNNAAPIKGRFTLVMEYANNAWTIIHDHSS